MKKTYKNVLISLIAIGLLAGCSQKDVSYESSQSNTQQVANNMDNIAGEEAAVESSTDESTSNEYLVTTSDKEVNSVTSNINGQSVLLESIHFAFDKYNITDSMREVATTNAGKIQKVGDSYENLKIKLEGNCDEWGTDEYNYALGLKRAKSAKDALIADGVDADKIMMVSFGESNPVCTEKNVKCWKLNRRVDYRLLP
jgi:peptidoglycan-associated lipoprotein